MRWICWLFGHNWKIISFWNYRDASFCRDDEPGLRSHVLTLKCLKCGDIKYQEGYAKGYYTGTIYHEK